MKNLLVALSLALLAPALAPAQAPMGDYLDVMVVKIRPEKRADFDRIAHKVADANRKSKGDF